MRFSGIAKPFHQSGYTYATDEKRRVPNPYQLDTYKCRRTGGINIGNKIGMDIRHHNAANSFDVLDMAIASTAPTAASIVPFQEPYNMGKTKTAVK